MDGAYSWARPRRGAWDVSVLERHALVALAPALCVALFFGIANRGFQFDDGLIYQRYVRNVLEGNGLVYNAGVRFNGLTSPFYTLISVGVALVTRDAGSAAAVVSTASMLAMLCVVAALFARHGGVRLVGAGALLAACHAYFYFTFGVETTLFVLLLGVSILLFIERANDGWLGVALALLVLTRPEGALLVVPMAWERVRQKRGWPKLVHLVAPFALILLVLLFNTAYYGAPFPATAAAKIGQGLSGYWSPWPAFLKIPNHVEWFFGGSWLFAAGFFTLVVLGAVRVGSTPLNRLVLGFGALLTASYLCVNTPSYHWYYGPYYGFGYFYAAAGAELLVERVPRLWGQSRVRHVRIALVLLLLALPLVATQVTWRSLGRPTNPAGVAVGRWLLANTKAEASIAAVEIGYIGWYSGRRVIDILGLVNPLNSDFIRRRDLHSWLEHYEPDYIVMHDPGWSFELAAHEAEKIGGYVKDERFSEPGFKLLKRVPLMPSLASRRRTPRSMMPARSGYDERDTAPPPLLRKIVY